MALVRKNKDVMVYQREKGRKLFLVSLSLKHEVGAIADLSVRLEKARFSITSGSVSTPDSDGWGTCSFFIEANQGRPTVDEVEKILGASSFVRQPQVKEARNGLIVDSLNFPLTWNSGDRAIMLRSHFFDVMEAGARELLQSGADVLFYQMGYRHGKPTWDDLLPANRVKDKADLQEVISIYAAVGWGIPEVASLDPDSKTAVVRFADNFECVEKKAQPGSNFVRGHLAGLFTSLFGMPAKVVETRCTSVGDDYCEFDVTT